MQRWFDSILLQQDSEQNLEKYLHPVEVCSHIQYQVQWCKSHSNVTGGIEGK